MIRPIVHRADFARLLATRPSSRSAHFAVHHLSGRPHAPPCDPERPHRGDLSTDEEEHLPEPVGKSLRPIWLGLVVPKRQARRAVTRSLLKRQMRSAFAGQQARLPDGLWLIRLRQSFAVSEFPSAASEPLRAAVRRELESLFASPPRRLQAPRREGPGSPVARHEPR